MSKVGSPILPARVADPTTTDRQERGAINRFVKVLGQCVKAYKDILARVPSTEIWVNRSVYEFQLDATLLTKLLNDAERLVDQLLVDDRWFYEAYVKPAAEKGVNQARQNLAKQARLSLNELRRSRAHSLRMALIEARVFEEMKNLSADVKANMTRVLTDGMGRGLNPLDIARNLTRQAGINATRAKLIARTEIPTALRRARMDEDQEIMDNYGINTRQMHFSALSPTTRETHAARHGKLFTIADQQQWWSEGANAIQCKCTTISVLVDSSGTPLDPNIIKRAKQIKERVEARHANSN